MNRIQRRVAHKQSGYGSETGALYKRAVACETRGEWPAASGLYKKLLSVDPNHAVACDRLARLYLAQGKRDKASAQFAELVRIAPQTLNRFDLVLDTLTKLQPVFAEGLAAYALGTLRDNAGPSH